MNNFLYNNRFRYRASRHFLFFVTMVILFSLVLYNSQPDESYLKTLGTTFLNALFFFSYAYLTIFLLVPDFLLKKKVLLFILLFALVGVALSALKLVVSETIFYASIAPDNSPGSGIMNLRFIVVNAKDMTFIVAVLSIAKYVKDYLYAERSRKELEGQSKMAQKKLLQSQFDPHFLFNTINNLYALSMLNPEKTREVVGRIKIVLKYIIEESQNETVALNSELALVENYIQLEKLRYGKRLKVTLQSEGIRDEVHIPPMILFLLVENCFKHGSSLDAGVPWIEIDVRVADKKIHLITRNSKPQSLHGSRGKIRMGEGLKNLEKRLELLYQPGGYKLKIENQEKIFKVDLEIMKKIEFVQSTYR